MERRNNMWLVPEEDRKVLLEFFGKSKDLSWVQANPFVTRISQWKKVPEKDKNGKEDKKGN